MLVFGEKGTGDKSGQDREASALDSESTSQSGESDSEDTVSEIGTSNAGAPVAVNAGVTFSRNVPAQASAYTPDQRRAGLLEDKEDKAKQRAEHIPGS